MRNWYATKCKCGQILRIYTNKEINYKRWKPYLWVDDTDYLRLFDCKLPKVDRAEIRKRKDAFVINLFCSNCNKLVGVKSFKPLSIERKD